LAAGALAAGALSPSTSLRSPVAVAGSAGGDFVDRAGTRHPWEINRAHALVWDGKAYVPAGVVLHVPAVVDSGRVASDTGKDSGAGACGGTSIYPARGRLCMPWWTSRAPASSRREVCRLRRAPPGSRWPFDRSVTCSLLVLRGCSSSLSESWRGPRRRARSTS